MHIYRFYGTIFKHSHPRGILCKDWSSQLSCSLSSYISQSLPFLSNEICSSMVHDNTFRQAEVLKFRTNNSTQAFLTPASGCPCIQAPTKQTHVKCKRHEIALGDLSTEKQACKFHWLKMRRSRSGAYLEWLNTLTQECAISWPCDRSLPSSSCEITWNYLHNSISWC